MEEVLTQEQIDLEKEEVMKIRVREKIRKIKDKLRELSNEHCRQRLGDKNHYLKSPYFIGEGNTIFIGCEFCGCLQSIETNSTDKNDMEEFISKGLYIDE